MFQPIYYPSSLFIITARNRERFSMLFYLFDICKSILRKIRNEIKSTSGRPAKEVGFINFLEMIDDDTR